MFTKFILISIIQLYIIQTIFCVYFGHEVGRTSMDSTHYDRRIVQQQCPINNQMKESHQTKYFVNFKSLPSSSSSSTTTNNNNSNLILIHGQFISNYEEDQLITRASSSPIDVNNTVPLSLDQATIDVIVDKQIIGNLSVYVQVIECIDCPYKIIAQDLSSNKILNLTVNTKYNYRIRIELNNTLFCIETLSLYEHGNYILNVKISLSSSTNSSSNSDLICTLITRHSPNNIYIPLIIGGIILLILFIACIVAQKIKFRERLIILKNRFFKSVPPPQETPHSYDLQARTSATATDPINATNGNSTLTKLPPIPKISNVAVPKSKRLLSLDGFRGFALVAMIFINYGGGGYAQFEHAPWHGITVADIVFPFFVWMLGTSLVFSLKNSIDKGVSKRTLLKKVAIRTIKLFAIGFILNTRFKVDLTVVRILGVLPRFAIVYGVVATIEVLCSQSKQYLSSTNNLTSTTTTTVKLGTKKRLTTLFCDIINFPLQWLINIALITIWMLIIYLVPFEDCPAGYLGPGGLHENGKYENCTGGITGYIDRVIFTNKHLFNFPTCLTAYECKPPFDPENLFGSIPTMFLAYLGIQAGRILVMHQSHADRLIRLFTWGIISIAIGVGLTAGTLDGGPMPLNKNLWTLSFSLFTGGLSFVGFSLMYIIIDMFKWWDATPFQYPGSNSILIYILHLVFATYFPVQWIVVNTHAAHLAMGLWGCVFWIIVAYILFKKRIFLVL
ncbi:unnamed protein product [Rotaria sordida]|uniref:Heparan-alpha-glucosaminide N-acetyltransferase n=1 Tax=Rotaria sordida TaxID=392033 RepID=A0A813YUT2_9BILA|nr:unnamed protein product [Rotaria sordida]CAF3481384.1 unnamed protein product [Rotaria sordida]